MESSRKLPIYSREQEILNMIASNAITIVKGETGSGKTTQLPLILAKKFPGASIAITQPRRVAAISLAKRVAQEYGCDLGEEVGYSVRFDARKSAKTKILYLTDGMLLREFLNDSKLSKYSVLVLDEVHERSLRTDIILGLVLNLIKEDSKKKLKLVLMSATLDQDKFYKFLRAPIIEIPGRTFPISTFYSKETLKDPINSALITIFQIHQDYGKGDILVFLPGQEEILDLERLVLETAKDLDEKYGSIIPIPFYAALPSANQSLVFEKTPNGSRKVILATNIAETSITIPGISFVIDTGLVKVREYFPRLGMESLSVVPVSQASANQRKGRAGRVSSGMCLRLFTEENFGSLEKESAPEIKRVNISSVILLLKTLNVEDVSSFPYLDPPPRDAIIGALENLFILGALDEKGQISKLGKKMAAFPLDPVYSRILIESESFGVVNEVASIIALLSIDPIFYSPRDKREEAADAKKQFLSFDGDHITLLNVMKEFQSCKGDQDWCSMHFISYRSLKQVMDIRRQLLDFCQKQGMSTIPVPNYDPENILKSLLVGNFQNTALLQQDGSYKTLYTRQTVFIHPSSSLFGKKKPAVVYSELVSTSKKYLKNVSSIPIEWLIKDKLHSIRQVIGLKKMFLYNLTLAPPSAILMAIVGNFSGGKMQEIITASNSHLSLLKADPTAGKVVIITSFNIFGIIRSISPFRLPGSAKDYIVVGSDSGRIAILEYLQDKNTFSVVHMETFGKSGCRRIVPGQYVAVDPKGRAVMIGSMEKSKFVYVLNRDIQSKLTISSPLEAHKSHIITWDIIGVDVGFENPTFACIELDYSEADQDPSGEAFKEAIKALTFYELDLGLNHVVRKWSEEIDFSSHRLISVPGGSDGPSGVLVCSENFVTWMHPDYSSVRIPIPKRPELYDINKDVENGVKDVKGVIIVSGVVHKLKNGFFILAQTEFGDIFKITMDYTPGTDGISNGVDALKIKYFDTVPVASSIILLKSGFLFAASEFGNHALYQIENLGDDDEEQIEYSSSDMDEDNASVPYFTPRSLRNIVAVDEMESLAPIIDANVQNLTNEETPQVHVLCGQGGRSTFRILKHGLEISEMAVSELPGNPNAVWTVKSSADDPYDAFIIVSFINATLVLSIGDTVEEVTDTGFLSNTPTLAVAQMGEDALVQIYPSGIRHIRSDRRVSEWRTAANRPIEMAACNRKQVVISLSGGELVYFELDSSGQLNEFQERKEMTANVTCLTLGPIPEGRQRSRFLAVGCADNTVRIISLDPDSCLQALSMQALTSTAESLAITNSLDPATGIPTLYLNIGLQNGIFLTTVLDNVTGVLSDSKLRFLGSKPVKLFKVRISNDDAVLALSSRAWLSYNHNRRSRLMPLSYTILEYGSSFTTEACLEGMVAIAGNTLRILSADKLDSVFNQTIIPLKYTPRRQVFDEQSKHFIIIETDNNTFSPMERQKRFKNLNSSDELPVEQFGLPVAGLGNWASCLRIINPLSGETTELLELENNEAAFSITICEFKNYPGERFLIVGTAKDLEISPRKCTSGYMHVYRMGDDCKLSLLHTTEVEDAPLSMREFHGRLLVGIGKYVRIYELGIKKLLRKCESLEFPNLVVNLNAEAYRIVVCDVKESTHYIAYKPDENKFVLFADDSTTRWITCTVMLDYGTVVGADKFGNVFINRIPLETTEDVEEDPTGSRMVYTRGYLQGAALKADHLVEFYVGDTVTSITRTSMAPGGREVLLYTTLHGGVGILVPFISKDEVEIFRTLEMALRNEIPPICGRDHAAFRSSYFPVKGVVDGDLCELYNTLPNEKKRQIAEMVDRTATEVSKKLEDARNRVAF